MHSCEKIVHTVNFKHIYLRAHWKLSVEIITTMIIGGNMWIFLLNSDEAMIFYNRYVAHSSVFVKTRLRDTKQFGGLRLVES